MVCMGQRLARSGGGKVAAAVAAAVAEKREEVAVANEWRRSIWKRKEKIRRMLQDEQSKKKQKE